MSLQDRRGTGLAWYLEKLHDLDCLEIGLRMLQEPYRTFGLRILDEFREAYESAILEGDYPTF